MSDCEDGYEEDSGQYVTEEECQDIYNTLP